MCVSVCNAYVIKARLHGQGEASRRDWSFVALLLPDTVRACLRGKFNLDQADRLASPLADRLFDRLRAGTLHYLSDTAIRNALRHLRGGLAQVTVLPDRLIDPAPSAGDDPTDGTLTQSGWYQALLHLVLLARRPWCYFRLYAPRDAGVRRRMASPNWMSGRHGMMGPLARLYLGTASRQNLLSRDLSLLDTVQQELERARAQLHEAAADDDVCQLLRQIEQRHEQSAGHSLGSRARAWLAQLAVPTAKGYPVLSRCLAQIAAMRRQQGSELLVAALDELAYEGDSTPPSPDAPFPESLCAWLEAIGPAHLGERPPRQVLAAIRAAGPPETPTSWVTAAASGPSVMDEERQALAEHLLSAFPGDPIAPVLEGMLVGHDMRQLLDDLHERMPTPANLESSLREAILVQLRDWWAPVLQGLHGRRRLGDLPCLIHQVPDVLLRRSDPAVEVRAAVEMISGWQTKAPPRWPDRDVPGELAARSAVFASCLHQIEITACSFYSEG